MEVIGKIKLIGETKEYGSKGFRKRELVITTEEQYPQHITIEFMQDKCDLLNSYDVNTPVKVGINLQGREWINSQGETKHFNSIQGWRIDKVDASQSQAATQAAQEMNYEDEDDLPF